MAEPSLFSDSEGESDVDSDGDNLMGHRQKHGHEPHSIPLLRLNKIAEAIIAFYDGDDSLEHERGTQLYRLFQHLKGGPIGLKDEESNRDFLRLLREQPDGPPPVQDNDLPLDKEAVQERLQYETDKIIKRLEENGRLKEKGYFPTEERSETYNSDKSYDLETGPEAGPETDNPDNPPLNKEYDNFPDKTFANEEEDWIPLSLNNKQNFEPPMDLNDEDLNFLTQNYESLLTPEGERGDHNLPPLLNFQRPRANFIATPLGWSLLEIPSCS